jgi:hypothetical protein
MAEEAPAPIAVAAEQPIAVAPAKPVMDAQTAQMLLALQNQQSAPAAAPIDPYVEAQSPVASAEEAFRLSGGVGPGASPVQVREIHTNKIPKAVPTDLIGKIPELRIPTLAEILGRATPVTPTHAVQQARARMAEALSKVKATAASPITPKPK